MKKELNKTKEEFRKIGSNIVKTKLEDTEKQVQNIFMTLSRKAGSKKSKLTLGERTADWMTEWAGSWFFIISFVIFLMLWMALNTYIWLNYISNKPFDPYPFILLNLILSSLAALQAPVILMSQNRATQRDRIRAEYDYQVNRRAEKEIREIKKQLDRLGKKFR